MVCPDNSIRKSGSDSKENPFNELFLKQLFLKFMSETGESLEGR